jgi:hypothetical protein
MTAEQALENAKGLTFEKVWATMQESHQKTMETISELSKNIDGLQKNMGGLQNTLGKLIETMFTSNLRAKFNDIGYEFTRQTCNTKYTRDNKTITEVDAILENGDFILLAEVKTEMKNEFVDDHLERIEKVREYMDEHNDNRKIIGAVAGGIVPEDVIRYAHKNGLFVIMQSGESSTIADSPKNFKERIW